MLNKRSLLYNEKVGNNTNDSIIGIYLLQILSISYTLFYDNKILPPNQSVIENMTTILHLTLLISTIIFTLIIINIYCNSTKYFMYLQIYFSLINILIQYLFFYHLSRDILIFDSIHLQTLFLYDIAILSIMIFSSIYTTIDSVIRIIWFSIKGAMGLFKMLNYSDKNNTEYIDSENNLGEEKENLICAICLGEIEENEKYSQEEIVNLKCHSKHKFHMKCLVEWCKKHLYCPICKTTII